MYILAHSFPPCNSFIPLANPDRAFFLATLHLHRECISEVAEVPLPRSNFVIFYTVIYNKFFHAPSRPNPPCEAFPPPQTHALQRPRKEPGNRGAGVRHSAGHNFYPTPDVFGFQRSLGLTYN